MTDVRKSLRLTSDEQLELHKLEDTFRSADRVGDWSRMQRTLNSPRFEELVKKRAIAEQCESQAETGKTFQEIPLMIKASIVTLSAGLQCFARFFAMNRAVQSRRLNAFEQRLATLEARPSVEYKGVWDSLQLYRKGDMVTHDGSVWHCELGGQGTIPGNSNNSWKLAVKHGRDAPQ